MQLAPKIRRRPVRFANGGFSLRLQLQLSNALFLLVLVSLFLSYPLNLYSMALAEQRSLALEQAHSELERILQSDYSSLMLGERYSEHPSEPGERLGSVLPTTYRIKTTITQPSSGFRVKRIVVVVRWGADRSDVFRRVVLCSAKGVHW